MLHEIGKPNHGHQPLTSFYKFGLITSDVVGGFREQLPRDVLAYHETQAWETQKVLGSRWKLAACKAS